VQCCLSNDGAPHAVVRFLDDTAVADLRTQLASAKANRTTRHIYSGRRVAADLEEPPQFWRSWRKKLKPIPPRERLCFATGELAEPVDTSASSKAFQAAIRRHDLS